MNNQSYWIDFYKENHISSPSSFTEFCLPFIKPDNKIIEFGCGNGRDTYFFDYEGLTITGVDFAFKPENSENATFIKSDLREYLKNNKYNFDVLYARFFLHSITNREIDKLLNWAEKGLVCFEFRAFGDEPVLYKNHFRNKIVENDLLMGLLSRGYDLIYYTKSRGLAVFGNEDPLIVRIIARRK